MATDAGAWAFCTSLQSRDKAAVGSAVTMATDVAYPLLPSSGHPGYLQLCHFPLGQPVPQAAVQEALLQALFCYAVLSPGFSGPVPIPQFNHSSFSPNLSPLPARVLGLKGSYPEGLPEFP